MNNININMGEIVILLTSIAIAFSAGYGIGSKVGFSEGYDRGYRYAKNLFKNRQYSVKKGF